MGREEREGLNGRGRERKGKEGGSRQSLARPLA